MTPRWGSTRPPILLPAPFTATLPSHCERRDAPASNCRCAEHEAERLILANDPAGSRRREVPRENHGRRVRVAAAEIDALAGGKLRLVAKAGGHVRASQLERVMDQVANANAMLAIILDMDQD